MTDKEDSPEDILAKFEHELIWCIEQLRLGLETQNPNSKQAIEGSKALKILLSSKAPMIKKRQVMRNTFGNYRKKMEDMERKSSTAARKGTISPAVTKTMQKSTFFKKSVSKNVASVDTLSNESSEAQINKNQSAFDGNVVTQSTLTENLVTQSSDRTDCNDLSQNFQFNFKLEDQPETENSDHSELMSKCAKDGLVSDDSTGVEKNALTMNSGNSFRFNFAPPT